MPAAMSPDRPHPVAPLPCASPRAAWPVLLILSLITASCASTAQLEALRDQQAKTAARLEELETELQTQQTFQREQIRKLWSQVKCKKDQIAQFLQLCKQGSGETCSQDTIAGALSFMQDEPYALFHWHPDFISRRIHLIRRGYLMNLVELRELRPSTRFLVLVSPRSDSAEHRQEALQYSESLIQEMRTSLKLPGGYEVIGPFTLPCKLKQEWLTTYTRPSDKSLPGEPPKNIPHVRIWIYRTDC